MRKPSLCAATAAVRDRVYLESVVSDVNDVRETFSARLQELGFEPLPSDGNFVLFAVPSGMPMSAADIDTHLRERGILLRPMGSYGLHNHLRVTVGTAREMDTLRAALADIDRNPDMADNRGIATHPELN